MSEKAMKIDETNNQPAWLQSYIDSTVKQQSLYRRTLIIVIIAQIFGGAGLAAGITVGALLAEDMLGTNSFAGLPVALFTLGSAGAAMVVGRLSQRFGRRPGLTIGFIAGGLGAIGVIFAAIINSVILLFLSLLIYGAGTATNLQARYAGTDMANTKQRATAVSMAMVSTTFGAVAGPNLVGVMGNFATSISVPALAGPFILAAAAYILAGLAIFILMRPDPFLVSKALAAVQGVDDNAASGVTLPASWNKRGVIIGATVMILSQIVMVAIMTMTPVHMGAHGHGLNAVGLVIGVHIGSMYLPSPITGILVDKAGRFTMAIASGVTLLASGILAAAAPGESMVGLTSALALLGLGWNFGLISGTAIIVDATTPDNRAKTQGSVDVFIALAGASGGAVSGVIVALSNFPTLSVIGGVVSILLVPFIILYRTKTR
ncbi:putative MFS-type transporter YdeG [Thalassobacillus devorans]|uniref:MFS-type transporter YdeG n=1 Tax=Thalassobacillus devorans TaxID=279813 RepID=A0ABQ1PDS1_9BACI|nr:MFS transporter [Thalassobacillus devorans]NIK29256.1 MFS family permease [Thalassobacillus devorans]GGC95282.1 putative MFS-type transporter YdeG [Thalassobacillus devorans]